MTNGQIPSISQGSNTMKPLVIYHDSCADGFGAAFAAWLKLGDDAEYFPCQYGKRAEEFDTKVCYDREVYVLDFSFPKMIHESIMALAKSCVWLDHHKSSFEMWCGTYEKGMKYIPAGNGLEHHVVLDDNKSGAVLAWEFFHPGTEVPLFIHHIDDYDRWQFKIEGTKAFNKALWSYAPWSFEQWKEICERSTRNDGDEYAGWPYYKRMLDEGAAILRAHEQNVASVVKGGARKCALKEPQIALNRGNVPFNRYVDIEGYQRAYFADGLAANCPSHLTSDVGHELAKQSGTFGLCWFLDKDLTVRCSLRSVGDYDVSAIATAFGGGGHLNAAGFSVDIQTLLGWLK